jgi:hypothetical protein
MSKKPMTWMDVIKEQLAKMRKEGKSPSIGDVTPAAKKEWADIKSGKHPLYMQGSSKGRSQGKSNKPSKNNKTQKMSKASKASAMSMDHQYCIEQMLKKVRLCKKDVNHIHKYMKTMKMQKGGGDCGCSQSGGGDSCSSCQEGGKGKKGRRTKKAKHIKVKGKKGKKGMKGGYVSIVGTDGLEDGTEETDGTNEKVVINEGEDN